MMLFKKMILAAVTGVIAITLSFFPAFYRAAAANEATSTDGSATGCRLDEALDRLLAVKDSDLAPGEKEAADFLARKNLLGEIIICSSIEIDTLKTKLSGLDLSENDPKDELLLKKFEGDLDAASFYYRTASENLDKKELTLEEVKNAAQNMLAWRETFYAPLIAKINNFLLVIESAEAVKTAKVRFQKISGTLSAVKLHEVREIKRLLGESDALIKKSGELNDEAHALIWSIEAVFENPTSTAATSSQESETLSEEALTLPASPTSTEQTANETGLSASGTSSTIPEAAPKPEEEVLSLVKESLGSIKSAYANYLSISALVRKILGL